MSGPVVRRRLLVIVICLAVALATAFVVDRSAASRGAGPGGTQVTGIAERSAPGDPSTTSTPGAATGTARGDATTAGGPAGSGDAPATGTGSAGGSGQEGGQVPARPSNEIHGLLDARAAAILERDRAGWLGALDPAPGAAADRFRAVQAQVFDRVVGIRPVSWGYQVAGGSPLPPARRAALGGAAWLADVQLTYQLAPDTPRVRRQQFLTVVRRDGRWLLAADTDGPTGRDLWDVAAVHRAQAGRCLVVGAAERRSLIDQVAAECGRSAALVDAAWGTAWPRRTVLCVPASVGQLAVLLGRASSTDPGSGPAGDATGLERTAAVTVGPGDGPADQVVLNGEAFTALSSLGRRVVLTHELVHVATRATGSRSAPTWLAEGYADHVAYAGSGLTPQQVAGEALAAVRAGRLPAALPDPADFDATGGAAEEAYGGSWVAVGVIADRVGGTRGLRTFYREAAEPGAGAAGLQRAIAGAGLRDRAALVRAWRARLSALAG